MEKLKGVLASLLKWIGLAIAGLACVWAVSCGALYLAIGPRNLSAAEAAQFVVLEPGDRLVRAYAGLRWLDSQRYFVIEADPAGFDRRMGAISVPQAGPPGAPSDWRIERWAGPGRDVPTPGERLPKWWDVADLPEVETVDVHRLGGHAGQLTIFARAQGRIYIVDR